LPKGDMYVRFNIVFPQKINNDARLRIIEALEKNELELV
jgi:DnaJ-class molecular chaperone